MSGEVKFADTMWHSVSSHLILWAELDADFAAYHRPSGRTHFLNSASHRLLTLILTEPRNVEAVVRELYDYSTDQECDAEALRQATQMLLRLEHLGLVERE